MMRERTYGSRWAVLQTYLRSLVLCGLLLMQRAVEFGRPGIGFPIGIRFDWCDIIGSRLIT